MLLKCQRRVSSIRDFMKTKFLFIFLFLFASAHSQDDKSEQQKEWFQKAEVHLKAGDLNRASGYFMHSTRFNPKSQLAKQAIQIVDSIEPFRRKALIKNIIGRWKLKISGSNWGMTDTPVDQPEYLNITETTIQFIKANLGTGREYITKTEKISFSETNLRSPVSLDLFYSDGSFWSYHVSNTSSLRVTYSGKQHENGRTEMVCGNQTFIYEKVD